MGSAWDDLEVVPVDGHARLVHGVDIRSVDARGGAAGRDRRRGRGARHGHDARRGRADPAVVVGGVRGQGRGRPGRRRRRPCCAAGVRCRNSPRRCATRAPPPGSPPSPCSVRLGVGSSSPIWRFPEVPAPTVCARSAIRSPRVSTSSSPVRRCPSGRRSSRRGRRRSSAVGTVRGWSGRGRVLVSHRRSAPSTPTAISIRWPSIVVCDTMPNAVAQKIGPDCRLVRPERRPHDPSPRPGPPRLAARSQPRSPRRRRLRLGRDGALGPRRAHPGRLRHADDVLRLRHLICALAHRLLTIG